MMDTVRAATELVMAGLDPAIYPRTTRAQMAGSRPAMTRMARRVPNA
jgi:hypothetical protein